MPPLDDMCGLCLRIWAGFVFNFKLLSQGAELVPDENWCRFKFPCSVMYKNKNTGKLLNCLGSVYKAGLSRSVELPLHRYLCVTDTVFENTVKIEILLF